MTASHDTRLRASVKATGLLAVVTLAWTASLALARFGPALWGVENTAATWSAVVLNVLVGLGWIAAITRYLRAIDELERKILLEALAAALGAGWVAGFGHVVADMGGLVPDLDLAVLPVLMGAVFMVAMAWGRFRYR